MSKLSSRGTKILLVALCAVSLVVGTLAVWARKRVQRPESAWPPPLSEVQARRELVSQCQRAAAEQRPLLVEFSAPWCEHCKAVKQAVREPSVARSLNALRVVVFNIGNDAALNPLRLELGARAIPAWVVIKPDSCALDLASWPRLGQIYPRGEPRALTAFLAGLEQGQAEPKLN